MHTSGRIHFLELDLIDRTQTFMKMRRRIHVSTPLTDMSEKFEKKSVTQSCRPALRPALFVGKTRPPPEFPARSRTLDRRTFCWLEPFVDRCERFLKLARPRAVGPGQIPLPKMITADSRLLSEVFTLMLLTVCAKGSEQLRTTQNKRRFCSCSWLIPVVHAKLVHTV